METEELLNKLSEMFDSANSKKVEELETKLAERDKTITDLTVTIDELKKNIPEPPTETDEEKSRQEVIDFIKRL